jgi:hypothetical protein
MNSGTTLLDVSSPGPHGSRAHAALLTACALVGTIRRIAILRLEPQELLARYGSDDMFYYTEVARHAAMGRGVSFDGLHPTSGVQPLWLALLAPLAPLFDGRPSLALRLDLALVTVLTLASGLLMPRLVQAVMGSQPFKATLTDAQVRNLGTLAGCIWLVHPRVLNVTFEGTEGALAALCWQLSVLAWAGERLSSESFRLGVALGVGTLARIDHLTLFGAFLAWPRARRRSLRRAASVTLPVAALWGSWLLFCVVTTGSFVPDSGAAKRLGHERYYALDLLGADGGWTTVWRALRLLARQLWEVLPLLFHTGGHTSRFSVTAMLVMTLSLAMATSIAIRQRVGTHRTALRWREAIVQTAPTTAALCQSLWPVFVAAAAVLLAHVLVLHHLRNWYAMPAQLSITLVASAMCIDTACTIVPGRDLSERPNLLALMCAFWLAAAWTEESVWPRHTWHPSYLATARRLVAVTPATARIGAFNAGILGAFASQGARSVVNLDGVVNHSALRAIESRTLADYIFSERIEFIADYPGTVAFAERISAPGLRARLDLLQTVPIEDRPGEALGIWRVRSLR